jgi:DNA invertase Pin-like site-specific DNA recombinase
MMQDMRKRCFDAVIVVRIDRLGRSLKHLLQILEEMDNKGIRFISLDLNLDTLTPQGKFFFTIAGAMAEFERSIIQERIKAGMGRAKSQGKNVGRRKGSRDKGRRSKKGYFERWEKEKRAKWHSKKPTPPK